MRATLARVLDALCAGRPAHETGTEIAAAFVVAGALWACACAFLLMEPLR